ncbi:MAG: hypothetical protein NVS4B8_08160 [Herpetosiphon sp.]
MAGCSISERIVEGQAAVEVTNGLLALTLVPACGGKIRSLRELRSGREWLWRHPRMALRRSTYGDAYLTQADSGGWDECFPTVAPCDYPTPPWRGVPLQDHGELWSQTALLRVEETAAQVVLHSAWHGVVLPYRFERTITVWADEPRVRMEYTVTNTGQSQIHYIWSAHPLLAIEPGMRLSLPPEARFHRWSTIPDDLLPNEAGIQWPLQISDDNRTLDFATLPDVDTGVAMKLWSDPLADGWATLAAHDGALEMRWDATLLPQVAFWMNLGAWAGDGGRPYYNLGLEPCMGAQDSLAEAVDNYELVRTLPPGTAQRWWLEITLVA